MVSLVKSEFLGYYEFNYRVAKRNATRKWREIDLQLPCWLQLTLLG